MNFWAVAYTIWGSEMTVDFVARDPRSGFDKKLAAYALAGGALFGIPEAASAGVIVVVPQTPIAISVATGEGSAHLDLDLDGDLTTDFTIHAVSTPGEGNSNGYYNEIYATAAAGNALVVTGKKNYFARGYTTGTLPAPGASFNYGGTLLKAYDYGGPIFTSGDWMNSLRESRFLAVQFLHNGSLTGGWIEIATAIGSADAQINSWAYDDPAVAPEPSSMALFAAGAAGVAAFRRRKKVQ
ncbi:MAG: PEP-CTERM sorting domain-containing protein [Bryobacteraceae bacterium]